MMSSSHVQYSPALSQADIEATKHLLELLYGFGKGSNDDKKLSKLLRHTDHVVPAGKGKQAEKADDADDGYRITSWKMQDYAYKRDPCPYPTRARGLFTVDKERIVARAYDKFFNVDEVSWTKWSKLPDLTAAPYYLTLKSNGCLILIAALSPSELLVTSKHAIGQAKQADAVSHAEMGERWLDKGLAKFGKTREQLAAKLWKENWTCVAELCDDSFEEHILPYSAETSGLHLHGLVFNHPTLLTLPPPEVSAVAKEWGFIETAYLVLNSISEVRKFTDEVARTGIWNGQHVEGFVVRAALKAGSLTEQPHPNDLTEENWGDPRRVFMWKIKFDQPYLMWREWREVTKRLLSEKKKAGDDVVRQGKQKLQQTAQKTTNGKRQQRADSQSASNETDKLARAFQKACLSAQETYKEHPKPSAPSASKTHINEAEDDDFTGAEDGDVSPGKNNQPGSGKGESTVNAGRIRNPETRLYVTWVERRMHTHPEDFVDYLDNRGIIAVREAFLKWRDETREGREAASKTSSKPVHESVLSKTNGTEEPFEKALIVPVAVPGCGKTILGVALSHLFGFGHIQSDDVLEKKSAKHFEARVAKELQSKSVVFADKNNHLKQHREAMTEITKKSKSRVKLVALIWPLDSLPQNEIHRICSDRIVGRGDNHQSLRPMKTGEHEVILMRFFSQAEPFDPVFNTSSDARFHETVEMNLTWDLEKALEYVVEKLVDCGVPGVQRPTSDQIQKAIAKTKGYKASVIKEMKVEGLNPKQKGPRYYGIAAEVDLRALLSKYFESHPADRAFFHQLVEKNRVETKPHVTLVHSAEIVDKEDSPEEVQKETAYCKELWKKCQDVSARWGNDAVTVNLTLGPLVAWDGRAMSIKVSKVEYTGPNVNPEAMPNDDRKDSYHITVGTLKEEIRPVEGKWLLESALKGEQVSKAGQKIITTSIEPIEVKGRVRGLF